MKHMKKLIVAVLSLAMVMGMMTIASAADNYKLKINNTTVGHTYEVYQIFTGDLSGKKLSNVKYGENYGTKGDKVPATELEEITNADAFAASIETRGNAFKSNIASAAGSTVIEGLPAGYYLVKETSNSVPDGETYTKYIVQIVGDAEVNVKAGTTSSEKKVKDDEGDNTDWNDSADYDIGDKVPFQLKATVASDYDNYKNGYKLTFHDKESAGLTFDKDSVKVYVDGTEITTGFTVTAPATDGDTFDVAFANLKNITAVQAGSVITVKYESELNTSAVIGAVGNPNTSHITYTNNPNDTQAGENGKTPDDTVIVFTYKLVVDKYANSVAESNKLTGAEFTLYKDTVADSNKVATLGTDGNISTFEFKGLDAGKYILAETKTPDGYNTIEPITIVITATHDVTADAPKLKTLAVTPADSFTVEMTTDNKPTGTINGNVINNSGSTLPETGGMGTTMFYLIGGILVIGAGLVLVTRRRMDA